MGYETVRTLTADPSIPRQRDWMNIGREYSEPYRAAIEREIDELAWSENLKSVAMMPALGISACIAQLKLPRVSAIAINGSIEVPDGSETAAYAIYGIEANYAKGQRVRVYVLDSGTGLTPLAADVFEGAA